MIIPLKEPEHFVLLAIVILGSFIAGYMIGHGRGWRAAFKWLAFWHASTMVRLLKRGKIEDNFDKVYTNQMWDCRNKALREWQDRS